MADILALWSGVRLFVFTGDGVRFARVLRCTWRALPLRTRRHMRRHWQRSHDVRVELLDDWSGRSVSTRATTERVGCLLRFHAPSVALMRDEELAFLIAHELAHVVQWVEGTMSARPRTTGEYCNVEGDADRRAKAWLRVTRRPRESRALREYHFAELVAQARQQLSASDADRR